MLLFQYICLASTTDLGFCSFIDKMMCLGATWRFVKSATRLFPSVVKRALRKWPTYWSGIPWMWTPHLTWTFHPEPSCEGVTLILNG
jgi:hypothetical protein